MADLEHRLRRIRRIVGYLRVERVFHDRWNPLEVLHDAEIFSRYRFRANTIVILVNMLQPFLERATRRSSPLPPLLCVLVSLHFMATSSHYKVIGDIHGVCTASVCRSVRLVVTLIARIAHRQIKFPTGRELDEAKQQFFAVAGFPNVISLIDCTHVRVRAPGRFERDYLNRKSYHSINVQMMCDRHMKITNVVAKWPGSVHDSRIFRESEICQQLEQGPHIGFILGDSGYGCRPYLMTPYLNPRTQAQERYNDALIKTRVIIERMFGVLKRRFPCLSYGLRTSPELFSSVVMACSFLHNFGIEHGDIFTVPNNVAVFDIDQPEAEHFDNADNGLRCRDLVSARYFS